MRRTAVLHRTRRVRPLADPVSRRTARARAAAATPEVAEFQRRPLYPTGSIQGPIFGKRDWAPHKLLAPVAYIDGFGERQELAWTWNNQCPQCAANTAFGYCTRCTWVCANKERPAPEPILVHTGAIAE